MIMLLDKLSFFQRTKLNIAKSVAPVKTTHIATFNVIDFEIPRPKSSSIIDYRLSHPLISQDFTFYSHIPSFSLKLLQQPQLNESNELFFIDFEQAEIFDLTRSEELVNSYPEIEKINIAIGKPLIKGKDYNKKEKNPEQKTLFGDTENNAKTKEYTPKVGRQYREENKFDEFDVFDIIFPSLQPPLGSNFNNTVAFPHPLYPFQVDGVKFLHSSNTVLLGDEMGLGKSIQAITAARLLFREGKILNACIICPKAVLTDWQRKIWEWAPELKVIKIEGDKGQRELLWSTKSHFYIVTYKTLLLDVFDRIKTDSDVRVHKKGHSVTCTNPECGQRMTVPYALFFESGNCPHCGHSGYYPDPKNIISSNFDLLIIDEIQNTKNPTTKTTKAVRSIKSIYKWGLSGTPLENKIEDLITICETIKPDIFKNINPYRQSELISAYKPIFLRRKKIDVLEDLPDKISETIWLDLLPSQRRKYDLAEQQGIIDLEGKGEQVTIQHVLALITKLKQICNYDIETSESSKLDYLLEKLDELTSQGDKALVFSQYPNETLKKLLPQLKEYNPNLYDGSLSDVQRNKIVDDFQTTDNSKLMLLSLKAGNAGITLTKANYVYHFDLWWNPAVMEQANDRAHRIGAKKEKTVWVNYLLSENTIERRIFNLLESKRSLFKNIVDDLTETPSNIKLTEEEIFGLFGLTKKKKQTTHSNNGFDDLDPIAFENFIAELFKKMGYYSQTTKRTGDGGIDIYAKLQTPTSIDEIIIQCKHKEDVTATVDVGKVRELFGVLQSNYKLKTGYLVTNGRFTNPCKEFANGKPIELIDGIRLLGLVEKFM